MGGAVGGTIKLGGPAISTAASLLSNYDTERKYYRSMAAVAEEQARQIEELAKRNATYIFGDEVTKNNVLEQNYATVLGQQKTMWAANGLDRRSATAQLILKNSRLNAQLDQEQLVKNLNRELYENQAQASLQAQQYRTQAAQYNRLRPSKTNLWTRISSTLLDWWGNK